MVIFHIYRKYKIYTFFGDDPSKISCASFASTSSNKFFRENNVFNTIFDSSDNFSVNKVIRLCV